MGKTKTAFIAGVEEEKKTSKQKYEEKRLKKKALEEDTNGEVGTTNVPSEIPDSKSDQDSEVLAKSVEKSKKIVEEKRRGKKYLESKTKIDKSKNYSLQEASVAVKQASYSKFDGTMEIHLIVKKVPTTVTVTLPNSFGKGKKIEVATDATLEKLSKGKIEESEDEKQGTIREMKEELGLNVVIKEPLGKNEYIASDPEKGKIRKQVNYFLAEAKFENIKLGSF